MPALNRDQWAALAVVDRHGHARIADRTSVEDGTVRGSTAHALIRRGELEPLHVDGVTVVRRRDWIAEVAA